MWLRGPGGGRRGLLFWTHPRVHGTLKLVRPCLSVVVAAFVVDLLLGAVVGRVILVVHSFC